MNPSVSAQLPRCHYFPWSKSGHHINMTHLLLLVLFATADSTGPIRGETREKWVSCVVLRSSTSVLLMRTNLLCGGPRAGERQTQWTTWWGPHPRCPHSDDTAVQRFPPHSPAAQTGWNWNITARSATLVQTPNPLATQIRSVQLL